MSYFLNNSFTVISIRDYAPGVVNYAPREHL